MSTTSARITGTGSAFPRHRATNTDLRASDEWVRDRLGIEERRIAADDETTSVLATDAARRALKAAERDPADIDLVIVATATPDMLAPSVASMVQAELGAVGAAAFDVAAVCSGFMYGLGIASAFIESRRAQRCLLIGADTFSRITDWTARDRVFFGDGAGAVVMEPGSPGEGMLSFVLHSDGTGRDGFSVPSPAPHRCGAEPPAAVAPTFSMDGQAVYRTAIKVLPEAIDAALDAAGVAPEEVALVVPHQPSVRILEETASRVGIPFDRFVTTMDRYANTAGASVGVAFDEAASTGRLNDGDVVVVAAVGSGWTWGAGVMRWSSQSQAPLPVS